VQVADRPTRIHPPIADTHTGSDDCALRTPQFNDLLPFKKCFLSRLAASLLRQA
jgi:hypothetical protein